MRWKRKTKTIYDNIKRKFALFPVTIDDEWVWLEHYYAYSEEDYAGTVTWRFHTYNDAAEWLASAIK